MQLFDVQSGNFHNEKAITSKMMTFLEIDNFVTTFF